MNVEYRSLQETDLRMLFEWLNRPHLLEWWGGEQSVDEVRAKYLPRIAGQDAACLDNCSPISRKI